MGLEYQPDGDSSRCLRQRLVVGRDEVEQPLGPMLPIVLPEDR